jgi:alkaline phosphatase
MNQTSKTMLNSTVTKLVTGLSVLSILALTANSTALASSPKESPKPLAKNIILLIADGGGFNQMLATDYYQYGDTGMQVYQDFPSRLAVSTYEYEWKTWTLIQSGPYFFPKATSFEIYGYDSSQAWSDFGYAIQYYTDPSCPTCPMFINRSTDSASSATAMSTGTKTKDGSIGVDINGNPLTNIVQIAESLGKSTGVVTSVGISHATPAAFVAHNTDRSKYAAITEEMLYHSAVDVIMGCGALDYDNDGNAISTPKSPKYIADATWTDIQDGSVTGADANGDGISDTWTVIRDRDEFLSYVEGDTPTRVLGIPYVYDTLQYGRASGAPLIGTVPTLEEMTNAALNILDNNQDGFFLMIEGGAIDSACHARKSERMIQEYIDFNHSVEAVVNWVQKNSNWGESLVIVTADHESGYLWGPGSNPTWEPIVNNGVGVIPSMEWYSLPGYALAWHSNSLVPLFAKGDAARLFKSLADENDTVRGSYLDNTEIFEALRTSLTGTE